MNLNQCEFELKNIKKSFPKDHQIIEIFQTYGYETDYRCPMQKEEGEKYCLLHNRERVEELVSQGKKIDFIDDLSKLEFEKNNKISIERELSPFLLVGCFFPDIIFPSLNTRFPLDDVIFINCELLGNVVGKYCHFNSFKSFRSRFHEPSTFSYAHFHQEVILYKTDFLNTISFQCAKFNNNTTFYTTLFEDNANFYDASFSKVTIFARSIFSHYCLFYYTSFLSQVIFQDTEFLKVGIFNETRFYDIAIFKRTIFIRPYLDESEEIQKNCYVTFYHCLFMKPQTVIFDDVNFKYVSLIGTNLSLIRFQRVRWDRLEGKYIDELLLQAYESHFTDSRDRDRVKDFIPKGTKEVMDVFRCIRESLEHSMEYVTAGDFFYQEIELKRWALKHKKDELKMDTVRSIIERFLLFGYKWTSRYGESYTLVIIWILLTIPLFTLLTSAVIAANSGLALNAVEIIQLLNGQLQHSVGLFFQVSPVSEATFYFDIIERIFSIFLFGNLFIALRRQYERKIRS